MFKDLEEQINFAYKMNHVADGPNRKTRVTLQRYSMDKKETCYVQIQIFARRKEEEKPQNTCRLSYKVEHFFLSLDFSICVTDKFTTNQPKFKKLLKNLHKQLFPINFF